MILLKLIPYIRHEILHFPLFFIFFPRPLRQLLSLSNLVRVQCDPALPYFVSYTFLGRGKSIKMFKLKLVHFAGT